MDVRRTRPTLACRPPNGAVHSLRDASGCSLDSWRRRRGRRAGFPFPSTMRCITGSARSTAGLVARTSSAAARNGWSTNLPTSSPRRRRAQPRVSRSGHAARGGGFPRPTNLVAFSQEVCGIIPATLVITENTRLTCDVVHERIRAMHSFREGRHHVVPRRLHDVGGGQPPARLCDLSCLWPTAQSGALSVRRDLDRRTRSRQNPRAGHGPDLPPPRHLHDGDRGRYRRAGDLAPQLLQRILRRPLQRQPPHRERLDSQRQRLGRGSVRRKLHHQQQCEPHPAESVLRERFDRAGARWSGARRTVFGQEARRPSAVRAPSRAHSVQRRP